MNILITGANGQLGRALRRTLQDTPLAANTIFTSHEELDITQSDAVGRFLAEHDITHIINCAAFTDVDDAEEHKAECTRINSDGVKSIALAADSHGAKVIHISTDFVFDGHANRAYSESDKVNPISHYGTTKRQGETALLALAPDSIIIRTSWLYLPGEQRNFPGKIIAAARDGKNLNVVDDQIGSPTNALDLARAIVKVLSTRQWFPGIYHYCNTGICSRYDMAKTILRLAGLSHIAVTPIATGSHFQDTATACRPNFSALNTSKIRLTYGVETPWWVDSLAESINLY